MSRERITCNIKEALDNLLKVLEALELLQGDVEADIHMLIAELKSVWDPSLTYTKHSLGTVLSAYDNGNRIMEAIAVIYPEAAVFYYEG